MDDIAGAAKMSRPALYLVFSSKEEILTAVLSRVFKELLDEIRQGVSNFEIDEEKLMFAFEIWSVRPFEMIQTSPDAKDLLESSYEFAGKVTADAFADFESIVSEILEPLINSQSIINLTSCQVAHILTSAVRGFKNTAATTNELRQLISDLVTIVLASFQSQKPEVKKSKAKHR